jgi:parallel beta-helix repeat protein
MKPLFGTSILGAILSFLSVASYGQTPITSVPYTITASGAYIFAHDLTYSAANGVAITVTTNNVIIDLNGHILRTFVSNSGARGIEADNRANVQVRNGAIAGFSIGVLGWGANPNFGHLVDGVRFWNNSYGVYFYESRCCVVQNCQITGPGLAGVYFNSGTGNRAANNVATGLSVGFSSSGTDYFDSNYADNCSSYGFYTYSATTKLRFNTTTNCATGVFGGTSEGASDQ